MIIRCRNFRGKSVGDGVAFDLTSRVAVAATAVAAVAGCKQHSNLIHPGWRNWAWVEHVRKTEQLDRNKIKSTVSLQGGGGGEERLAFN